MVIDIQDILTRLNKPARYLGNEINAVKKDFKKDTIKVVLAFPDLYEIGMSHLGFRILYGVLNKQDDIACERVFSPARDLENILRQESVSLFSLESKLPLKGFDILGFSLCYELNYTNALNILELAGLPLLSSERKDVFPLVIAGGNCCLNPEPVAEIFDLFVIGEAEEAILEITNIVREYKKNKENSQVKSDLLKKIAAVKGVYVPSLYNVEYFDSGSISKFYSKVSGDNAKIEKRFVADLNTSFYPLDWVVPYISIVHDRIGLEIMRGCPNKCSFCQARASFWPLRMRSKDTLMNFIDALYKNSGYEEISLLSLSTSDYPHIYELVKAIVDKFKDNAVGISLPSLRARSVVGDLVDCISKVKNTALTLAPEAGTERLRKFIGKNIDMRDLMLAVKKAKTLGYRKVKLYFMIGLPTETKKDLDGIIDLVGCISDEAKINITVSISNFVPKPHTSLQRVSFDTIDSIAHKLKYIKSEVYRRNRRVRVSVHDVYMSYLECILTRGDRRLTAVIIDAFKKGARFDSWYDEFSFNLWDEAFKINRIDPNFYCREIDPDERLPWGHINAIAHN